MVNQNRNFVVVGLGSFGGIVATELTRFGNHVLGLDRDERRVSELADSLSEVAILDATDERALREAGVDRYDCGLVSMGDDLESSILAAMNLRLVGVDTVWAKADSRTHHRILSRMGLDRVILPDIEMGQQTAQMLNNPAVQDYLALGNGQYVVNLLIPETRANGTVAAIGLPDTVNVLGVMRGSNFHAPTQTDLLLAAGDRVLLLGRRADLAVAGDLL